MAVTTKDALVSDRNTHYRRTWQLNRHLTADLKVQLTQLRKKESTKIVHWNKKIDMLQKELKLQNYEKAEFVSNPSSCFSETLSRPATTSTQGRKNSSLYYDSRPTSSTTLYTNLVSVRKTLRNDS